MQLLRLDVGQPQRQQQRIGDLRVRRSRLPGCRATAAMKPGLPRWSPFVAIPAALGIACATYESGLGYRARQAADAGEIDRFDDLMWEAVIGGPRFPGDLPERTVLTHFLALAGHDRFLSEIETWISRGWFDERVLCSVYRARHDGQRGKDPREADRAAEIVVERARALSADPERRREVRQCLEGAPFLLTTSTAALSRWVEMAADVGEPEVFRRALLEAMSRRVLRGPDERFAAQVALLFVAESAAAAQDPSLVAEETAFGAFEIERVALQAGTSWFAALAESGGPRGRELAWAWVHAMKRGDRLRRFERFLPRRGDRGEPAEDTYWYTCTDASGGVRFLRGSEPLSDPPGARAAFCPAHAWIDGPYPLSASAWTAAVSRRAPDSAAGGALTPRGDVIVLP
jgi:hypothetical protein